MAIANFAGAILCAAILPARGGVHDDAAIWFRGGHDANGDGVLQADEFVDSAHAKGEAAYQACTVTGGGSVGYAKGEVWSSYSPSATNRQTYLSFPNGDAADAASCAGLNAANPYAGTDASASKYTIHLRFRWDGKVSPAAAADGNKMTIFGNGVNWSRKSGFRMSLKYFEETDDFAVCWTFGANEWYGTRNPTETDGVKLTPGEWNDWFLTVEDVGAGHNAYVALCRLTPGKVTSHDEKWCRSPWISAWTSGGTGCCSVSMYSGRTFLVADSTFSGDVSAWAFWPRVLTDVEMRKAAGVRPGDAIFRLGEANGSSREFAAEGAGRAVIDAEETWDAIPPRARSGDALEIRFAVDAQSKGLSQVLRVKAAEGSAVITAKVATYDRTTQAYGAFTRLKTRMANASHDALFFVPDGLLAAGGHVVRLEFEGDLALDAIELGGSWRIGVMSWALSKTAGVFTAELDATNGYDLATGCWNLMNGSISADESPLTDAATTVRFDVPADMVGCARCLWVSLNQFKSSVDALRVYVNDTLVREIEGPVYQFLVPSVEIPPSAIVAGENLLRIRRITSTSGWWGGIRGLQMQVRDAPNPNPLGFCIRIR